MGADTMSNETSPGVLYLCATPIGNLEDMTIRAIRILKEVDVIGAEDTRHTRKLLSYYDIHTPLISYHEHNKFDQGPILLDRLLLGDSVAIVSDAGLPGISDPGAHLAELVIEEGIQVVPIPGANAALSALIASGLDTTMFTFVGFLPKTSKKREERFNELALMTHTLIFYESPHRIKDTLKEMHIALGNRRVVIARELTKIHEEFIRGTIVELLDHFKDTVPKGEFTVIVEGCKKEEEIDRVVADEEIYSAVKEYLLQKLDKKTAMKLVAEKFNLSKRDVYKVLLK